MYIYIYDNFTQLPNGFQKPVLTNCPRRRDGPCQSVRAGTSRASSSCKSMGLTTEAPVSWWVSFMVYVILLMVY